MNPIEPGGGDAWALPSVEPATLVALWPHDEPPTMTEVVAAVSQWLGRAPAVRELDEPDVRWACAVELPALQAPVLLFSEEARTLSPDEIDDPRALGCRWAVGAQTILDTDDPVSGFADLVAALCGAIDASPALLDVNCGRWHPRDSLRWCHDPQADAPPEMLWMIHSVGGRSSHWMHTHGLWRCGLPELEMLEVPQAHVSTACTLVNALAARLLEEPVPEPGEPWSVGADLQVVLQPWQQVVPYLQQGVPGSRRDRDQVHAGVRAVVCGSKPRGAYRQVWTCPEEVLRRLEEGGTTIFLSQRSTEQAARQARATWPRLVRAFAAVATDSQEGTPGVQFLVKAGLTTGDKTAPCEHLWFAVRRFEEDRAEAVLLNEPTVLEGLAPGDAVQLQRQNVSDWVVQTPSASYAPADVDAMEQAIARMGTAGKEAP